MEKYIGDLITQKNNVLSSSTVENNVINLIKYHSNNNDTASVNQLTTLLSTVYSKDETSEKLNLKISPRQWSQINFNTDVLLPCLTIPSELSQPKRLVRYNEQIFLETVAYILSIIQEVAFGIFKVRGSDNKIYCVPANTRKISFTEAWDEYNSKFTKKERFGQERFKLMMDVLAPEKEKILNSLDSCSMKYGTNNFNLFERLINTIFFNCNNSSSSSSSSSSSILNQNFKSFLLKQNK